MTRDERAKAVEDAAANLVNADIDLAIAASNRHHAEAAYLKAIESAESFAPVIFDGHLIWFENRPLAVTRRVQVEPIRSPADMFPPEAD